MAGVLDYGLGEKGDGRFAVGAGYGEVGQFRRGVVPALLCERGGSFCRVVDDYDFAARGLWLAAGSITLADDEFGAVLNGLIDEAVAVVEGAFNSYEDITGLDKARIGADARGLF